MNISRSALLATLLLLPATASFADDGAPAVLRCDPATVIKAVDGDEKKFHFAGYGGRNFRECAIPMTPGLHYVDVCFDAGSTSFPISMVWRCDKPQSLPVDIEPGHIYRVGLGLTLKSWSPRIEDVTEKEIDLPFMKVPDKKDKKKESSASHENETTIVLRATPEYAYLGLQEGTSQGKWFRIGNGGSLKLINAESKQRAPNGYHLMRVAAGSTFALTNGRAKEGSPYSTRGFLPCGNFPIRVYENVPGGKVLYLGHLDILPAGNVYLGTYREDFDTARAYIDEHYPELAGRLEAAPHRDLLSANICQGIDDLIRP